MCATSPIARRLVCPCTTHLCDPGPAAALADPNTEPGRDFVKFNVVGLSAGSFSAATDAFVNFMNFPAGKQLGKSSRPGSNRGNAC